MRQRITMSRYEKGFTNALLQVRTMLVKLTTEEIHAVIDAALEENNAATNRVGADSAGGNTAREEKAGGET